MIRQRRNALSPVAQQQAAQGLALQFTQHLALFDTPQTDQLAMQHVAIYLTHEGEIDTAPLIAALQTAGKTLYLPVLHPFAPGFLIFQRYEPNTPMRKNRFGIAEPMLNCHEIKPVAELDSIFTPLVAFDLQGQRLGMGGGFYDRTLAQLPANHRCAIIGLAHDCQLVDTVPIEPWDHPLSAILTPSRLYTFKR